VVHVESTVYRHLDTSALIIGPESDLAKRCKTHLEEVQVRVVRVLDIGEAFQHIASVMPQLVVVLCSMKDDERGQLSDRTTAVGAITVQIDPNIDEPTLDTLLDRAAQAAIDRGLTRDEPVTRRQDPPKT
jgi:hypothetical protein